MDHLFCIWITERIMIYNNSIKLNIIQNIYNFAE